MAPFLVVGLGNPGVEYKDTRHNIGFKVIDCLSERHKAKFSKKFRGEFAQIHLGAEKVLLLKPHTYMNLSGRSVQEALSFYKVESETRLMVINDDLDLATGRIRIRKAGGSGGHNGLEDIILALGTEVFARLRVGIGKPSGEGRDYVLSKMGKTERKILEEAIQTSADAVETFINEGIDKAMNVFNRKKEDDDDEEEGDGA